MTSMSRPFRMAPPGGRINDMSLNNPHRKCTVSFERLRTSQQQSLDDDAGRGTLVLVPVSFGPVRAQVELLDRTAGFSCCTLLQCREESLWFSEAREIHVIFSSDIRDAEGSVSLEYLPREWNQLGWTGWPFFGPFSRSLKVSRR